MIKFSKVSPTGTAFATSEEACCGCLRSKYAWPKNAGFAATTAPSVTCGTCYVSDRYETDAKDEVASNVMAPGEGSTPAFETVSSKVEEIHEWNWNCAEGFASEDPQMWKDNFIMEGEPATRGPYKMCGEKEIGFFCKGASGPDLEKAAGDSTEVKRLDSEDENRKTSVKILDLPKSEQTR